MDIKIVQPKEIWNEIINFFKNNSLIPIVGAGFSAGLKAYSGRVPNAIEFMQHMKNELLKNQFTECEKNK